MTRAAQNGSRRHQRGQRSDAPRPSLRCPIDGGESRFAYELPNKHGPPDDLDIYECRACRLLYVATPVSAEQLASAYESHDGAGYYAEIADTSAAKAESSVRDLAPRLSQPAKVSVLDVGCGYGHFLHAVRQANPAVRVVGAELDPATAAATQAQGFEVTTQSLSDLDECFDVIAMLDVAEHVQDPVQLFVDARRLLKPGGVVYLHTPRRSAWDAAALLAQRIPALRGAASVWLRTRVSMFHLRLWSDASLERALTDAGLQIVESRRSTELSWPIERYAKVYLGETLGASGGAVRVVTAIARLVFVRLHTLRNKAIITAVARPAG